MKSGRVRLPDAGFTSNARLPKTLEPIPTTSPDLAIEVLSDSNTAAEIRQKLIEYFQTGTRLAWIVDPSTRTVAIYHKAGEPTRTVGESDMLDGGEVLLGLSFEVSKIFKRVPRGE
jgi:Uma2 family endonuclease